MKRIRTTLLLAVACLHCSLTSANAGAFTHEVMAEADGSRFIDIFPEVSINAYGTVAFVAKVSVSNSRDPVEHVFVALSPGTTADLSPDLRDPKTLLHPGVIINNKNRVVVRRQDFVAVNQAIYPVDRIQEYIADASSLLPPVDLAEGSPPEVICIPLPPIPECVVLDHEFHGIYAHPTINNKGSYVFLAFNKGTDYAVDWTARFAGKGPLSRRDARPLLADNDTFVVRSGNPLHLRILHADGNYPVADIASAASGFDTMGQQPGISEDGQVVAFYGVLNAAGARSLSTTPGPGIFVSFEEGAPAVRRWARITGWSVENVNVASGDKDGFCEPNEPCLPAPEINGNALAAPVYFGSYDADAPVRVVHQEVGSPGIEDDILIVTFSGTPNVGSVQGLYSDTPGFWTIRATIPSIAQQAVQYRLATTRPRPVVQVGETILGHTVEQVHLYDPLTVAAPSVATIADAAAHAVAFSTSNGADKAIFRSHYVGHDVPYLPLSQCDPRWASDFYPDDDVNHANMCDQGCALTCLTMMLSSQGYQGTPRENYQRLSSLDRDFIRSGGRVSFDKHTQLLTGGRWGFKLFNTRLSSGDDQALNLIDVQLRDKRQPVLIKPNSHHFVLVVGKAGEDYLVSDPGYPEPETLFKGSIPRPQVYLKNQFEIRGHMIPLQGQAGVLAASSANSLSGLSIATLFNAELVLVDSSGRRVGNIAGNKVSEIPNAIHFTDAYSRDYEPNPKKIWDFIIVEGKPESAYTLIVKPRIDGMFAVSVDAIEQNGDHSSIQEIRGLGIAGNEYRFPISTSRPGLKIRRLASGVELNWPTNSAEFRLEATPSLVTSLWQTITNRQISVGSEISVVVENFSGSRFFRLRKE